MSKERDLLARIVKADVADYIDIINEAEEIFAQPEKDSIQYLLDQVARLTAENAMLKEKWSTPKPEQEPVVWMFCEPTTGLVYFENSGKMEHGWIPLYMVPPAPEPLSDEEIYALDDEVHGVDGFAVDKEVLALIRAVEKAHGIIGE
jgi:hypothetical protein